MQLKHQRLPTKADDFFPNADPTATQRDFTYSVDDDSSSSWQGAGTSSLSARAI
nr:hypothetical protein [uncultured Enterobacter sp.]